MKCVCVFSKWATPSVDAQQWPSADPGLQIWPLSDRRHSDGRFLSDWNRGLSSTGFLRGGEEKQPGFYWSPRSTTERAWTRMRERKCDISWARTGDPVDGDAFHPADAGGDDVLPPRLITFGPRNLVQSHVCPVHSLIACQREKKKRWYVYGFSPALKQTHYHQNMFLLHHFTKRAREF